MRSKGRGLVAALVVALVMAGAVGCASNLGSQINRDRIQDIQPGRTTEQEVTGWFGAPARTVNYEGFRILVYEYVTLEGYYEDLYITMNTGVVANHSARP